jgi:hypothetical protein
MIKTDMTNADSVESFYSIIRQNQERAHGNGYCLIHDAMKQYIIDGGCQSYKEIGTQQGATAVNALLAGVNYIELVDIDFSLYREFLAPLAEEFCKNNNVELVTKECNSISKESVGPPVDLLLIDSCHKWSHTKKELKLHQDNVNRYIVLHDTFTCKDIAKGLKSFVKSNPWIIIEEVEQNVGYMTLKRIEDAGRGFTCKEAQYGWFRRFWRRFWRRFSG